MGEKFAEFFKSFIRLKNQRTASEHHFCVDTTPIGCEHVGEQSTVRVGFDSIITKMNHFMEHELPIEAPGFLTVAVGGCFRMGHFRRIDAEIPDFLSSIQQNGISIKDGRHSPCGWQRRVARGRGKGAMKQKQRTQKLAELDPQSETGTLGPQAGLRRGHLVEGHAVLPILESELEVHNHLAQRVWPIEPFSTNTLPQPAWSIRALA
jgi:hypothetical protein